MEYLVKDKWSSSDQLGVTQPNEQNHYDLKIVWEKGSVSYPWIYRDFIEDRFEIIKEITDHEAKKYLFAWELKK